MRQAREDELYRQIPPWSKSFRTRHRVALSFGRFQFFFFCCVGRSVIDLLSDFQLDSLTFIEVTLYFVHLFLCVISIFHKEKCHRLCSNKFALNFVLKMNLTVRRLWKCWRSVSTTILSRDRTLARTLQKWSWVSRGWRTQWQAVDGENWWKHQQNQRVDDRKPQIDH